MRIVYDKNDAKEFVQEMKRLNFRYGIEKIEVNIEMWQAMLLYVDDIYTVFLEKDIKSYEKRSKSLYINGVEVRLAEGV